jgi:cobalt-precorrin 5A hydrolase
MDLDQSLDKTMIAAGIGCKRGTSAPDIEAAIRTALARAHITPAALDVIATIEAKSAEAGIRTAAEKLGVAVVIVPDSDLALAGDRVETHSKRVLALTGVGSVAEAAALAAAGPAAKLISPRLVMGSATCALAASAPTSGAAS